MVGQQSDAGPGEIEEPVILHVRQDDDAVMFVGPDQAGNLIEVGVVTWHGILAIVHAMSPARDRYLKR